jgi:hypothetical protein
MFSNVDITWTCLLPEPEEKHFTIFLDENVTPQMKMVRSSITVVLNHVQWLVQVTFKDLIPKDVIYELCDSRHTLDFLYSRQYMCIVSDDVLYYWISRSGHIWWNWLSSCIDMQITKLLKLHDDIIQWRNKCLESESFCTLLETSAIDLETLCEIMHKILR